MCRAYPSKSQIYTSLPAAPEEINTLSSQTAAARQQLHNFTTEPANHRTKIFHITRIFSADQLPLIVCVKKPQTPFSSCVRWRAPVTRNSAPTVVQPLNMGAATSILGIHQKRAPVQDFEIAGKCQHIRKQVSHRFARFQTQKRPVTGLKRGMAIETRTRDC